MNKITDIAGYDILIVVDLDQVPNVLNKLLLFN